MKYDETKLPKWAQDLIKDLERRLTDAGMLLSRFQDKQSPSKVWFEEHPCLESEGGPREVRCYIQSDRVNFQLGDQEVEVRLLKNNTLSIHSNWKRLVIVPEITNHIVLEVRK